MIVLDASALLAILLDQEDREAYEGAILDAEARLLSEVSYLDAAIRLGRAYDADGVEKLNAAVDCLDIDRVGLLGPIADRAAQAYLMFGKGRHVASLNFGECCAYALAMHRGAPLLFAGEKFRATDVAAAR